MIEGPDRPYRLESHLAAALGVEARPLPLVLFAGIPSLLAVWALWSTGMVVSRVSVMDLLFNLS
ncbi:hypothetical protein ACSTJ6_23375, partial [Vibrio parahaemolyticus]